MSKLTDNQRFVWTFENESEFESFIKAEPHHVFGSEKIQWDNERTLPGSETIPGSKYGRIRPDMIGWDANGNVVIVEIKVFREEINNNRKINNRDAIHKAVGQILNYADAYLRKGLNPDIEGFQTQTRWLV